MTRQNFAMLKNVAIYRRMPEQEKEAMRSKKPLECGLMDKLIAGKEEKDRCRSELNELKKTMKKRTCFSGI